MSKNPEHKDSIGQDIEIGKVVAFPYTATILGIGTIVKVHPKMITVKEIPRKTSGRGHVGGGESNKYPSNVVVLNEIPETLMFLLTKP